MSKLSKRTVMIAFVSVGILLILVATLMYFTSESVQHITGLDKTIVEKDSTIGILTKQIEEYQTYIADLESELESIKENFETYKEEVNKGVQSQE